jgi:hypothetical protein
MGRLRDYVGIENGPLNQTQAAIWNEARGRAWADLHTMLDEVLRLIEPLSSTRRSRAPNRPPVWQRSNLGTGHAQFHHWHAAPARRRKRARSACGKESPDALCRSAPGPSESGMASIWATRHASQHSVLWLFELCVRQNAKGGAPRYALPCRTLGAIALYGTATLRAAPRKPTPRTHHPFSADAPR